MLCLIIKTKYKFLWKKNKILISANKIAVLENPLEDYMVGVISDYKSATRVCFR